jgi:hypothetical protein
MVGTKNLYNTNPLEIVREALERGNALPLQREFIDVSLDALGTTQTLAIMTPLVIDNNTPYVDAISLPFPKLDLSAKLPKDMCYSGNWPATFEDFASFMMTGYGLLILPNQWQVTHDQTVYTLAPGVLMDHDISIDRSITLSPSVHHPLFTATMTLPMLVTSSETALTNLSLMVVGDSSVQVGDSVNVQFIPSGGLGPYSFTLIEGSLPSTFNEDGTALEGTYDIVGQFTYTVQLEDSLGQTAFATGSTEVILSQFGLEAGAPDSVAGVPYVHQYQFNGGLGPYQLTRVTKLPPGLRISSTGLLEGKPEVGQHQIDLTFTDAIYNRYRVREIITVHGRNTPQVRTAIRDSLVDWLELSSGFVSGTPIQSHPISNVWTPNDFITQLTSGLLAAGVRIIHGNLERPTPISVTSDIGVALWLKRGVNTRGSSIFTTIGANGSFEIRVGDHSDSQVRVTANINGVMYGLVSRPDLEVLKDMPCFIVAQVCKGSLSLHCDGELIAWTTVPINTDAISGDSIYLGSRSEHSVAYQWNGTLITSMIFNQRIWGDEISYLYNAGHGRQFAELKTNYDPYTEVIQSNLDHVIEGKVDQPLDVVLLFNGVSQIAPPRLYSGDHPNGLIIAFEGPHSWRISGTPLLSGSFATDWAVIAEEMCVTQRIVYEIDPA